MENSALAVTNIACLGDSITVGFMGDSIVNGVPVGGEVVADKAYCSVLKTTYGYNTQNFGVGEENTGQIAARTSALAGKGFNYTIIIAGTNDVSSIYYKTADLQTTYNNLSNIAQTLKNDNQKIVISTIPPWPWGVDPTAVQVNSVIRRVFYEKQICYADIYTGVFNSQESDANFLYKGNGDGVHPNDVAQAKMAAVYDAAIKKCVPYNCVANPQNCYTPTGAGAAPAFLLFFRR